MPETGDESAELLCRAQTTAEEESRGRASGGIGATGEEYASADRGAQIAPCITTSPQGGWGRNGPGPDV